MDNVLLGLGSNLGDKKQNIINAIKEISKIPFTQIVDQSSVINSSSVGFNTFDFYNCVIIVKTNMHPFEFQRLTKNIEFKFGKKSRRRNEGFVDRIIDIDVLVWQDIRINTPNLILPHPEILNRKFVLFSLKELALRNEFVNNCENWNFFYNLCHDKENFSIIT